MIRFNIILLLLFVNSFIFSQTFNLDAINSGSTHTTCNATLYDSGGPTGQYGNSENYFITFCSGTTDCMQIDFVGTFAVESGFDQVSIFDGPTTGSAVLGSFDGVILPPTIISSGTCVTIQFTSDSSVPQDGFQANITCTGNCPPPPPASIVVDITTYTHEELVTDVLITGCLEAYNVVYTGDPLAIGYFYDAYGIGIQSGVIMSSGYVMNAPGNGNNDFTSDMLSVSTGDPLLDAIVTPDVTTDVAILEFDFVPSSDTLEFNFIFGSEEYPEYVFSFNDVFAFFLTGTNPAGGNYTNYNIALIPGTTTPVSIYNVNNGSSGPTTGPCVNCAYYVDNWAGTYNITYDGFTTPITAVANVVACDTYHIKLAVADVNDMSFDSAVLLEEASFTSGGQVSMNHVSPNGNQNEIIEGCTGYWVFTVLDTTATDSILVDLILSGTADPITDLTNFQTTFWIPAGQVTDTLYYSAIFDNINEGVEFIVFSLSNGCPCTITTTSDTIWIFDNFSLNPTITPDDQICINNLFTISTTINPLIDPSYITYTWSTGDTISSITETPLVTTTYTVTITQICQPDTILSMTLIVIPDIGTGFSASDNSVCIGDPITFTFTDTAGVSATYTWTFTNGTPNSGNTQGPYTVTWSSAGTYDVSLHIDDNGCSGDSTIQIIVNPNPSVTLTPTNITCYGFCNGEIAASPNGIGTPYTYLWDDPANQITEPATNLCPGTYNVTFTNVHGCTGTNSSSITEPTQLTSSVTHVDVLCFGQSDGSATVSSQGGTGNHAYLWSANTGSQITPTATNLSGGTYSVTVTDYNGCTSTSSATISEPSNPLDITLFGTDVLCFGGSDGTIDLTVTGGTQPYSFNWDSGNITEDISYLPAGTYCVTVTDALGCTISDCTTINEPTALTYTTSTTNVSCFEGLDGMAAVNVANGTPPYTYLWNNGDVGSSAVNISAGTYIVIVTDDNGCSFTTSMTVTEPDRVMASTNADMWICIGETASLNAAATGGTPGYTFHWSNGQIAQNIDVLPVTTTQYCMHAEDSHGCISNNYCVNVNVYLPISIVVTSDVDRICPGEPVTLSVVATGGNGNYTHILNNSTVINPPYTDYPIQSLSYTITVSDDCGSPTDFGTVSITVLPMPPNSFSPDITEGCQPHTVQFIESSPDMGQTYNWNFDDENSYNTSANKNPSHIFEEAGVYDITLTVTDTNGCINVDVVEDLITVNPKPVAKFEPDPEIASVIKPVIYFNNLTIGAVDYHWFFGDGDSSLAENPYHIYASNEQTYIVELKVESEKGCLDTVFLEVRIKDEYTFFAPTAFSPDGDNINDEFFVVGHGIDERNFKLIIYNRWGETIFETDDPNAKWNGNVQGKSNKCQLGTYTWLCKFKDVTGVEHSEAGAVTIIR